ncbi:hypothetical protein BaRGS_00023561 [Batillaria attramentaria]|uniref:Uncharacterized protein n=1 Tax=Batillaria attramentaria TaxID=370345 RepID=A0ABD0KDR3_9CAEN
MEYGGSYMRSAGQEMPLYQYLLLDVMAVIVGVVSLYLMILCLLVQRLYQKTFEGGNRRRRIITMTG